MRLEARRRGIHLPTSPTEVSCSVLLEPLANSVMVTRYPPWTWHETNLSLSVNCRYTLPNKNMQKRTERSKSMKYNYFFSSQVHERATKVGRGLVAIGCEPSQKSFIGIYGPNRVEVWYRMILTSTCTFIGVQSKIFHPLTELLVWETVNILVLWLMRLTEILKKFSKLISIVLKQEYFATIQNEKNKLEYHSSFFFS